MQGRCTGEDLKTKALICDDVNSNAPQCSNCRRLCTGYDLCKGFNVNLSRKKKGECVLKKRKLAVNNIFSKEICFERGNKVYVATN